MADINMERLETGVLIVGAGGTGLRAAIEAKNAGADVLVVAKGAFPSGCTPIAMGVMLASFDERDSTDQHFEDTLMGGDYLNNKSLVRMLVDWASETAQTLERYGTNFRKRDNQYLLFPETGSTVARGVTADEPYSGGYIRGLVNEITRLDIKVRSGIMVAELIKDGAGVAGAVGLEPETDTMLVIAARAVILATGGAGNLYHLTTNPAGLTGDGYALAYRAGVRLQDMEFIQGRVCMISPKGMRGTPPPGDGLVTIGGRFYNALCERYMKRYFPDKLEQVTRAQMSLCAQKEIQEGRHSPNMGVYGELSGVPGEELSKFKRFLTACKAEGFDPTWQPYEWAPGVHHFMGGVVINTDCETGVPGLYAAGEIAAGVHGSNRIAGNALTETQVFGTIAGRGAAARALVSKKGALAAFDAADAVVGRFEAIRTRDGGTEPGEVKDIITEAMSRYVGVIRNEEGLAKAAEILKKVREHKADSLYPGSRSLKALMALLEVKNLLEVGGMVVEAAAMRKETRGAHNREDYQQTDDAWRKNIAFQLLNGRCSITMKDVNETF